MELEAGLEHDREEVLAALENTEASIREAEEEVGDVEKQQQQISYSQVSNKLVAHLPFVHIINSLLFRER